MPQWSVPVVVLWEHPFSGLLSSKYSYLQASNHLLCVFFGEVLHHLAMNRPLRTLLLLAICHTTPLFALTVNISVNVFPTCNYPSGQLHANASGGVGPYSYLWSNGATTEYLFDVAPGFYSVTVTDANSDQATDDHTLVGQPYSLSDLDSNPVLCSNGLTGVVLPGPGYDLASGLYMGPLPYYVEGQLMQEHVIEEFMTPVDTVYTWVEQATLFDTFVTYTFEDGAGCTGTLMESIGYMVEWPQLDILDIQGACAGGSNGSITFQTGLEGHGQWTQVKIETIGGQYLMSFGAGAEVETNTWNLPAGDYQQTQFNSESGFLVGSGCHLSTPFTIPDLGNGCGNISGTVYMDNNEDCARQGGEPGAAGVVLEILPGPVYTITSNDLYGNAGHYSVNLPLGAYTVQQQSAVLEDHCLVAPAPFTLNVGNALQTLSVADTALVPLDASVSLASGAARPGFQLALAARIANNTLASTGASTLTVTFDPVLSFLSANPAPSNIVGNTLTWNVAAFSSFQERTVHVQLQIPPDILLLGTDLLFNAAFATGNADAVLANNSTSLATTVTGSYDPNDKTAHTSSGASDELYYIDQDEWIDYTIRFQNTGTDTAFNIVITDTIPTELDLGTLEVGASSHPNSLSIRDGNVLRWAFYNIQLPDSNVNEPASHGFVSFRIKPRLPLAPTTPIENIANIFFDLNPPVITEPSVLTAEFSTSITHADASLLFISPNPTSQQMMVRAGSESGRLSIHVHDGRLVLSEWISGGQGIIDVSGLPAGPYVLVWEGGTVRSQTKLIKAD